MAKIMHVDFTSLEKMRSAQRHREKLQEQVSARISVRFDHFDMFTQANKY